MSSLNNTDAVIYQTLADELAEEIRFGVYTPGGRLPSVKDMAARKRASQSAIQRAYQILEQQGIIYRFSAWGYFVSKRGGRPA